ncbi:uncharacterized protein LOC131148339 [Malania oleifera]|uniref:uncharacterized protein LOC131148339 n=1 Tax=Malania oleifera TaxID=397392 RepID=UPI0025AE2513|nr:uncharacterized protein LOC131148339 [Malania oleifera]
MTECGANSWMTPILNYLKDGRLPDGRKESLKLKREVVRYCGSPLLLIVSFSSQPAAGTTTAAEVGAASAATLSLSIASCEWPPSCSTIAAPEATAAVNHNQPPQKSPACAAASEHSRTIAIAQPTASHQPPNQPAAGATAAAEVGTASAAAFSLSAASCEWPPSCSTIAAPEAAAAVNHNKPPQKSLACAAASEHPRTPTAAQPTASHQPP